MKDNKTPDKNEAHKAFDTLSQKAKDMKEKFEEMDESTKKKVMAGVGGALALLATIGLAKKIHRKKKNKDTE